jgi:hypothetical protein
MGAFRTLNLAIAACVAFASFESVPALAQLRELEELTRSVTETRGAQLPARFAEISELVGTIRKGHAAPTPETERFAAAVARVLAEPAPPEVRAAAFRILARIQKFDHDLQWEVMNKARLHLDWRTQEKYPDPDKRAVLLSRGAAEYLGALFHDDLAKLIQEGLDWDLPISAVENGGGARGGNLDPHIRVRFDVLVTVRITAFLHPLIEMFETLPTQEGEAAKEVFLGVLQKVVDGVSQSHDFNQALASVEILKWCEKHLDIDTRSRAIRSITSSVNHTREHPSYRLVNQDHWPASEAVSALRLALYDLREKLLRGAPCWIL